MRRQQFVGWLRQLPLCVYVSCCLCLAAFLTWQSLIDLCFCFEENSVLFSRKLPFLEFAMACQRSHDTFSSQSEQFFLQSDEKCLKDSCRIQLGHHNVYRCLQCCTNVTQSSRPKDKLYYLKWHCLQTHHDLTKPPVNPYLINRLTKLDLTTIREGLFRFAFRPFI